MRDLLSKLDAIISETALNPNDPKGDYEAKRKALDDLDSDGQTDKSAIQQRRADLDKEAANKGVKEDTVFEIGDDFGISFSEDFEIGAEIVDILEDGIVIELDETAFNYLSENGLSFTEVQLDEEKQKGLDGKACWKGYKRMGTKMKGGKRVDNCVKVSEGFGSMEEQVQKLLNRFEQNAMERGAYGNVDTEAVVSLIAQGDYEGAAEEVWNSYSDQDGGEVPQIEAMIDDLQDDFEALGDNDSDEFKEGRMSDVDIDLQSLANRGDEEDLIAALEGEMGPGTADVLQNMMEELKDELASKGMNDVMNDEDKMIEMLWDKIVDEYGGRDDSDEGGETDDNYALASAGFGSDEDYESIENEAKYQGREVPLGKPMKGDVKKSKVYVKNPQGRVVKVNFGDKKMRIKKSNPNRRKSFRARHNCANPGPRHKARYWSCRAW